MAAFAIGTWLCAGVGQRSGPSAASLPLISGSRTPASHIFSLKATALNPNSSSGILHCSFLSNSPSASTPSASSFSGLSLGLDFNGKGEGLSRSRRAGLVIRAGKYTLCQTKRNRSRKSLARTHGFRRRMRTTSGRALLKRRRDKGRWNLCPKSNPNSGKRA
ncbi:unnamed protein product [Cuscuta epithymum]|uniref:Large ribosomal subunit protein bL34c n=1 Tax=Cuscuta epithymum TaxID=186058 RepID=A0AAV0F4U5_9ASTE|nr:unnamed protein product [Cuscuta epithymum]CAH9130445.1 unnamed protein product [Cuscuta epithymum]